ncbi:MAG: lipocalin-like domain-containing protein [Pseudomonadota bacterium]
MYPLGERAGRSISYSHDGFVFVHMMARDRSAFATIGPFGGTPEEDAAAMKSRITDAGTYEAKGDQVMHRVTQAPCPSWVGTEQVRRVGFSADRLQLSAANARFEGKIVTAIVTWERAES